MKSSQQQVIFIVASWFLVKSASSLKNSPFLPVPTQLPRWPWTAQPEKQPYRVSCYECYGSIESCATNRRNLIGGPKIKRCSRFEDQCLVKFNKKNSKISKFEIKKKII